MNRRTRLTSTVFIFILALPILVKCGRDSPTKPQQPTVPARIAATDGRAATDSSTAATATASSSVSTTTSDSDRAALVALYNATNGSNWTNNTNWLSELPLGDWHGVTLDSEGRVIQLVLDENNLQGPIPSEIGQLNELENLSLRDNGVSGVLPVELGKLKTLSRLDLASNRLTGTVPIGIVGELTNLEILDLQSNRFSGLIPTKLGSRMWYLALGGNDLSGPIPPELGQLSVLRLLNLQRNNLSGHIPPELGRLTTLKDLFLSNNRGLSGTLPLTFINLTNLTSLYLGGTGICAPPTPEMTAWLSSIPNKDVAASCADLDIAALTAFFNTTGGSNWTNNGNWLSDLPLNDWFGITTDETGRVRELNLSDNNLQGAFPPEIVDLHNLKALNLSGNAGLGGQLPLRLTLLGLESLILDGTGLCAQKRR